MPLSLRTVTRLQGEGAGVPTIDLPDDELAAVTVAIRGVIEGDRYPRAPRLDPLRAALARFEAASKPAPGPRRRPKPTSRCDASLAAFLCHRWPPCSRTHLIGSCEGGDS
jgi:hypothetical protein